MLLWCWSEVIGNRIRPLFNFCIIVVYGVLISIIRNIGVLSHVVKQMSMQNIKENVKTNGKFWKLLISEWKLALVWHTLFDHCNHRGSSGESKQDPVIPLLDKTSYEKDIGWLFGTNQMHKSLGGRDINECLVFECKRQQERRRV